MCPCQNMQSSAISTVSDTATAVSFMHACGHLQFRFIVDGVWKWAEDLPAVRDDGDNYINILEVHEYVPENLESLSGFEPPASPPSRYATYIALYCARNVDDLCLV